MKHLRALKALGWGTKRIARELGIARNSVRRYLREGAAAETQTRPGAWTLDAEQQVAARALLDGPAAGNGVVVQRLLADGRSSAPSGRCGACSRRIRQTKRAAELATVQFETAWAQMQIDFGEKWIVIAGARTKVHMFVAVLGYSRRIFVRASLSQRQDDWREGLAGAFVRLAALSPARS
ncbi:MAG: transposase [Myxococcales bacterium]|nr:transposase [Myxococcales bacterium]